MTLTPKQARRRILALSRLVYRAQQDMGELLDGMENGAKSRPLDDTYQTFIDQLAPAREELFSARRMLEDTLPRIATCPD